MADASARMQARRDVAQGRGTFECGALSGELGGHLARIVAGVKGFAGASEGPCPAVAAVGDVVLEDSGIGRVAAEIPFEACVHGRDAGEAAGTAQPGGELDIRVAAGRESTEELEDAALAEDDGAVALLDAERASLTFAGLWTIALGAEAGDSAGRGIAAHHGLPQGVGAGGVGHGIDGHEAVRTGLGV
ncbi:MAG: hypothetical protein U5Q44_16590 [Dehalococcoidia bacterium]|nr:hypothetical protein [Dehalococcoidia bacterium]